MERQGGLINSFANKRRNTAGPFLVERAQVHFGVIKPLAHHLLPVPVRENEVPRLLVVQAARSALDAVGEKRHRPPVSPLGCVHDDALHAQPVRALDDEGDDRVHWNCWLRKAVGGFLKCAVFFSAGKETCVLNLKPGFMCGEKTSKVNRLQFTSLETSLQN